MRNVMNYKFATKAVVSIAATLLLSANAMASAPTPTAMVPGAACDGTANTLLNKTLQGKAIAQTFPEAKAICVVSTAVSDGATAQSFFVNVKDVVGKPVTCQVREYTEDGTSPSILASAQSSGAGTVEKIELTGVTAGTGNSTYISCTVPLIGQIITLGENADLM